MAKAKTRTKARKGKRGGKGNIMTFLFLILPAALVVLPTTMIMGIGLIPTLVALVVDRDPEKSAAITVGGLNFCGCMPFLIDLWKTSHTTTNALHMISDPFTWLIMYGSAAAGWFLYFTIPPLVANAEIARSEKRIEVLKKKRVELIQEWGSEVSQDDEEFGGAMAEGR